MPIQLQDQLALLIDGFNERHSSLECVVGFFGMLVLARLRVRPASYILDLQDMGRYHQGGCE